MKTLSSLFVFLRTLFILENNIYVGCALTGTPQEFRDSIGQLKDCIRRRLPGWRVLEFLGLEKGTARDVLRYDLGCVASSRLFVALVDKVSTGLGMEIHCAAKLAIPTVIFAHRDTLVTRMVLGLAEEYPDRVRVERYESITEISAITEHLVRQGFYRKSFFGKMIGMLLPARRIAPISAQVAHV